MLSTISILIMIVVACLFAGLLIVLFQEKEMTENLRKMLLASNQIVSKERVLTDRLNKKISRLQFDNRLLLDRLVSSKTRDLQLLVPSSGWPEVEEGDGHLRQAHIKRVRLPEVDAAYSVPVQTIVDGKMGEELQELILSELADSLSKAVAANIIAQLKAQEDL